MSRARVLAHHDKRRPSDGSVLLIAAFLAHLSCAERDRSAPESGLVPFSATFRFYFRPSKLRSFHARADQCERDELVEFELFAGRSFYRLEDKDRVTIGTRDLDERDGEDWSFDVTGKTRWESGRSLVEYVGAHPPCPDCIWSGEETLKGRRTVKWRDATGKVRYWVDPLIGYVVREEEEQSVRHELVDIAEGEQPDFLFEIPALKLYGRYDEEDEAHCRSQGGTYRRVGFLGSYVCDLVAKDAGKQCSDGKECESGYCETQEFGARFPMKGRCRRSNVILGDCVNLVVEGYAQGAICSD